MIHCPLVAVRGWPVLCLQRSAGAYKAFRTGAPEQNCPALFCISPSPPSSPHPQFHLKTGAAAAHVDRHTQKQNKRRAGVLRHHSCWQRNSLLLAGGSLASTGPAGHGCMDVKRTSAKKKKRTKRAQHLAHSKWQGRQMRTAETFNGPSDCVSLPWRWKGVGGAQYTLGEAAESKDEGTLSQTPRATQMKSSLLLRCGAATGSMGRPRGQPPTLPCRCRCCWATKQTMGRHAAFLLIASWVNILRMPEA